MSDLFLIRTISTGDYNLENYLVELADDFDAFEEQYGNQDLRVAVLSLRDDIMGIPRLNAEGEALTETERLELFRERLADTALLDANGYLTVPFATNLDRLSPITANHKISSLEAELAGSDLGDTVARVYVRQRGTGSVRAVSGAELFYSFPERTAAVNTFFNGERSGVFSDDEIYSNRRLRDRPFANTRWELVINQYDPKSWKQITKEIELPLFSPYEKR